MLTLSTCMRFFDTLVVRLGWDGLGNGHNKSSSFVDTAAHLDCSAVVLDMLMRDKKSKSCPLVHAAFVFSREIGIKNSIDVGRGYSHTAILHFDHRTMMT